MLILLSPSKAQDFDAKSPLQHFTEPTLLEESRILIKELRKLSVKDIRKLMDVSKAIAELNRKRYKAFKTPFTTGNARQAVFAFQGDVYGGLQPERFDTAALDFAQAHVRILSGLYGLLKPLDLIQPYRLEMKIRLKNPRGKDLYAFWGDRITQAIARDLEGTENRIVVNLASVEYFKAVNPAGLNATLITPQFMDKKGGTYKMIGLFAKTARGQMARYIVEQRVTHPEALQFFAEDGYRLNVGLSKPGFPVYTRG